MYVYDTEYSEYPRQKTPIFANQRAEVSQTARAKPVKWPEVTKSTEDSHEQNDHSQKEEKNP